MSVQDALVTSSTVVVAVDVGKNVVAVSATDAGRKRLFRQAEFAMTAPALRALTGMLREVLPAGAVVRVGIEAAGHYHRPLLAARRGRRMAGPGTQPGARDRAAPGPGPARGQNRCSGPGGDDRPAAGRAGRPGHRAGHRDRGTGCLGGAPGPPGPCPCRAEEPAAGPARPVLPRADVGAAGRPRHEGAGWSRPSSPIPPGSPRWGWPGSPGLPRPAA